MTARYNLLLGAGSFRIRADAAMRSAQARHFRLALVLLLLPDGYGVAKSDYLFYRDERCVIANAGAGS